MIERLSPPSLTVHMTLMIHLISLSLSFLTDKIKLNDLKAFLTFQPYEF